KHKYQLSQKGSEFSLQLAGMSFEADGGNESSSSSFRKTGCAPDGLGDSMTRIIECDGRSFLTAARRGECEFFLLASSDVLDVDTPAATGQLPRDVYPALLPWLIFIRRAAGDRCWRNSAPRASLIIDDPLLRPRYGFLSYASLAESMRQNDFKTTIAFIPWNY